MSERIGGDSSGRSRLGARRFFLGGMYRAVLDALDSPSDDYKVILDVGCGAGWLLAEARKRWPERSLVGADPAERTLEAARKRIPDAKFVLAPAEAIPLPSESVDAVTSTLSFHHWNDREAGLREVARVLRPGGLLVIADFAFPRWMRRLGHSRHLTAASRLEVRAMLEAAGIQVVDQLGMYLGTITVTIGKRR